MDAFPDQFADILSPRARRALLIAPKRRRPLTPAAPLFYAPDVMSRPAARNCARLLRRMMEPTLRPLNSPIPPEAISEMRRNYSETLPKAVRARTASLNSPRSRASGAADRIGLRNFLHSDSLHRIAERLSGHRLFARPDRQVLLYERGDYTGPHNDHHPEDADARLGYVDVHLFVNSPAVANQLLIYERDGHLCEACDVSAPSGLAVYLLPFWHYTTPLIGRRSARDRPNRWVLMSSFAIDRR